VGDTGIMRTNGDNGELIACRTCGLIQILPHGIEQSQMECARCGAGLHRLIPGSRSRTLALALSAVALYPAANLFPVMSMDIMGQHSENTVWSGVVSLCRDQMYFIGGIVFLASILIPALKLLGLFYLALGSGRTRPRQAKWIYQIICKAGPWAMLDVFLLAIAVALIKFGQFGHVAAEPGIIFFALVVMLTVLASLSFDERLIWEEEALE
jgi:paraquat-inducible protein A